MGLAALIMCVSIHPYIHTHINMPMMPIERGGGQRENVQRKMNNTNTTELMHIETLNMDRTVA